MKHFYTLNKTFYTLDKTPLGETKCLNNLHYILTAQVSSFLIHQPFLNKVSYAKLGTLHLTVQPLRDLRDTMSRYWSPSASQPNPS